MHLGLEGYSAYALMAVEFLGFLLSAFWRPQIGIYLLIPLLPLQTLRYNAHGHFLGAQLIDVLVLGVIIGLKRRREPIFGATPLTGILLAYIGYTYLSMVRGSLFLSADLPFWFSDSRVSDWKNYVLVLSLIFFLTFGAIRTRKQMVILHCSMCLGLLMIAKNYYERVGSRDFSVFSWDVRSAGAMGNVSVNVLAAFEAQVIVLLIAMLLWERRLIVKAAYLLLIGACLYCLIFALSRGGYAAVLAGILFLGIVRHRWLIPALALFLICWQSLMPAVVQERIMMTQDSEGHLEGSSAARLSLWTEAMEVFRADPVFGTGFNTYLYGSHFGGYGDTHNLFVKILVETGVVGLALFLTLLFKLHKLGLALYHSAAEDPFLASLGLGFAGLIISAFIANLFGDRWLFFQITGYTYAFAGMVARGIAILAEEHEAEAQLEPGAESSEALVQTA